MTVPQQRRNKKIETVLIQNMEKNNGFNDEVINIYTRTLYQNILREVDRQNISYNALSRTTGISKSTIARLFNSSTVKSISVATLFKISAALNIEPSSVIPNMNFNVTDYQGIFAELIKELDPIAKSLILEQVSSMVSAINTYKREKEITQ